MIKIRVSSGKIHISMTGLDRLFSFRSSITIPIKSIRKAVKYNGKIKPPFLRFPGTSIPGIFTAGTYYGKKRKEFWNIRFRKSALVIDLNNFDYTRIVINADNINSILSKLKK